jgi:hypothetical protein
MKVKNELKMALKNLLMPFYQREIKEAFGVLYEIKRNLEKDIDSYCIYPLITDQIERTLIVNQKSFLESLKKSEKSPRELVFLWCYNIAQSEIEMLDIIEMSKRNGLQIATGFLSKELAKMGIE